MVCRCTTFGCFYISLGNQIRIFWLNFKIACLLGYICLTNYVIFLFGLLVTCHFIFRTLSFSILILVHTSTGCFINVWNVNISIVNFKCVQNINCFALIFKVGLLSTFARLTCMHLTLKLWKSNIWNMQTVQQLYVFTWIDDNLCID